MSYVTGSANSLADLLTAVQNACTAAGWTLSGSVLSKGNCYTQLTDDGTDLSVLGGTGIDGTNALTTPGPQIAHVGATHVPQALAFPCTYHIHVLGGPDEVYVHINHSVTWWQWLAFGLSPVSGLPGTGGWYAASSSAGINNGSLYMTTTQAGEGYVASASGALFAQNYHAYATWEKGCTSYMHIGIDGHAWAFPQPTGGPYLTPVGTGGVDAWQSQIPHLGRMPNTWNGETALLRIQVLISRASSKLSPAGELAHARYARNDNYSDGDVIILGADRWKIYPHVRKNTATRDGGLGVNHSGTFALAVRYDGP